MKNGMPIVLNWSKSSPAAVQIQRLQKIAVVLVLKSVSKCIFLQTRDETEKLEYIGLYYNILGPYGYKCRLFFKHVQLC